jgi:6-phosphogluconolactonase
MPERFAGMLLSAARWFAWLAAAALSSGCGGGDAPATYPVGGNVSGLVGAGLVLRNNGGDDLQIGADGSFVFARELPASATYDVTVQRQPSLPAQTCSVSGGLGTVANAPVTSVRVSCGAPLAGAFPRFLFVAGEHRTGGQPPDQLRAYAVDATTGALTFADGVRVPEGPDLPLVHPNGRFVYLNFGLDSPQLQAFQVDDNGQLTRIGSYGESNSFGTFQAAMDPLGRFVLAGGNVYRIDASSGALTELDDGVASPFDVAPSIDPTGRFAYAIDQAGRLAHYRIDAVSFALALQGTVGATDSREQRVVVNPGGRFVHVLAGGTLGPPDTITTYAVDATTGAPTLAGPPVELASRSAGSIAAHPSGLQLLVSNAATNTLSLFDVDRASGAVSKRGADIATGDTPAQVVFDPSGTLAYVSNFFGDAISKYAFDASTRTLTSLGEQRVQRAPSGMAISGGVRPAVPAGRFVYATSGNDRSVSAFRVDPSSGQLTLIERLPFGPGPNFRASAPVVHPSRRYLYVASQFPDPATGLAFVQAYRVDTVTGTLALAGPARPVGRNVRAMAIDPDGEFLYVAETDGTLRTLLVDAATGTLETAGAPDPVATGGEPMAVRFEPTGRFLYVVHRDSNDVAGFAVDPSSGEPTPIGRFATGAAPVSIAFAATGAAAYVLNGTAGDVTTFRLDVISGALRGVGPATTIGTRTDGVALHPQLPYLYASDFSGRVLLHRRVDSPDGTPNDVGVAPFVRSLPPGNMAIDPGGRFLYVSDGAIAPPLLTAYRIDVANGALSVSGTPVTTDADITGIVFVWGTE